MFQINDHKSAAGLLAGVPGLLALVRDPSLAERLRLLLHVFPEQLAAVEGRLVESAGDPEEANAALVRIRDVIWSISRDRLGAWTGVTSLASTTDPPGDAGLAVLLSVLVWVAVTLDANPTAETVLQEEKANPSKKREQPRPSPTIKTENGKKPAPLKF